MDSIKENNQVWKVLATNLPKAKFRSGNADGADFYFSKGVLQVALNAYRSLRLMKTTVKRLIMRMKPFHSIKDLTNEPEVVYQSKSNKKTKSLIDKYVGGAKTALP
jgi:hypothetical protein